MVQLKSGGGHGGFPDLSFGQFPIPNHTVDAACAAVDAQTGGDAARDRKPLPQRPGGGIGEVEDVRTALDWLEREFPLPIIFAGFSFGAAVGLRAAYSDDRVQALIALGLPAIPAPSDSGEPRVYDFEFLRTSTKPKLFVSGSRDQFAPPGTLETLVAAFPEPKKLVRIEAGDHFFEGRLREMRDSIEAWIKEFAPAR